MFSQLKMPNDLVLALTYSCNAKCRMCNIWRSEKLPVLELDQYAKLPQGLKEINLSGGEPFLHPQLIEIVKLFVAKNPQVRIIISSNGIASQLISQTMAELIKIKPDIGVGISIDGLNEIHDQIRGVPGAFKQAIATIKSLQKLGVKNLRIAFTAGDYNINQLTKVYQLSQQLGVEMTVAAIHNAANYFNKVDNQISKILEFKQEFTGLIKAELKSWNIKKWLRAYFSHALLVYLQTQKRLLPNYSGQDNIFIDPLGNVYPADISGHLMGNLKDFNSFAELYHSAQAQNAIALEKNNQNWMICTSRSAMKKHPFKVLSWILLNKFLVYVR